MRKRRQRNIIIGTIVSLLIIVAGYFSFFWTPKSNGQTKVSVGIVGASKGDIAIWKSVAQTVKQKYGIILTTKSFDGYDQPDKALKSGDVDLNAFSTMLSSTPGTKPTMAELLQSVKPISHLFAYIPKNIIA